MVPLLWLQVEDKTAQSKVQGKTADNGKKTASIDIAHNCYLKKIRVL
jgi:hypothetical protein